MSAEKKKQMGVLGLVIALVAVLVGSVLFVGAASGWFDDPKTVLDAEYHGEFEFLDLTADEYEELVAAKKSFVVFVDQNGCTTADRLRGYVSEWATEAGVKVYRMLFKEVEKSSLHDFVRFYPSVAVISRGKVTGFLRADSNDDAGAYNDFATFKEWMGKYL